MKDLERFVTILSLLENAQRNVGKTFIQKGIYILQEGLKEDLDYKYKLHFYGPFSQELANDIDALHDMGLINVDYDVNRNGYQIEITDRGRDFLRKFGNHGVKVEKIKKVLLLIGKEQVRGMELIGTVLYFAKLTCDDSEIKKLVNMVKPHFSDNEIEEALKRLKEEGII